MIKSAIEPLGSAIEPLESAIEPLESAIEPLDLLIGDLNLLTGDYTGAIRWRETYFDEPDLLVGVRNSPGKCRFLLLVERKSILNQANTVINDNFLMKIKF